MQSPRSIQPLLAQQKNTHLVKELLGQEAGLSRSELARELCRRLDLRDPKGHARIATTAKALRDLAAQGCWTLPAATVPAQRGWTPRRLPQAVKAATGVPKSVEDVLGLKLVAVTTPAETRIWNELILREHPLHACRLVGRQLR